MLDIAIRNATIITAGDCFAAEIGIRDGRITAIAEDVGPAAEQIDAAGLWVMPGVIDAHVHLEQPQGPGIVMADGFESGTRSAAAGGTTTVMPFALQQKGQSLREAVEAYHAAARGRCHVDCSFHIIITDPTPQVLRQELPALVKAGYSSFKVFMTYDDLVLNDAELLEVFDVARREKAMVMIHAEGHDAIRYMTRRLEDAGRIGPYYHAASHPEITEREATHHALSHAEPPITIVHVSGREAMEQIQRAKRRGRRLHAETCPQYIVLTSDDLKGLHMSFEGRNMSARRRRTTWPASKRSGRGCATAPLTSSHPIIARSASTIRVARRSRARGPRFAGSPQPAPVPKSSGLQGSRETAALPELRHPQVQGAQTGIESALSIPVAPGRAFAVALMSIGADQSIDIALHDQLKNDLAMPRRKSL